MKKILIYILFSVAMILSLVFDNQVSKFFILNKNVILHNILFYLGYLGKWYIVLIFISILFLIKNRAKVGWVWLAFLCSLLITYILKILILRPRPIMMFGVNSFPSGHATAVFTALPFIFKEFKFGYIWLIFCILIVFSRLYLGAHYLSDLIFGALVGYFIADLISSLVKKRS